MIQCYFDTSALVKRYYPESGTEVVGLLVDKILSGQIEGLMLSIAVAELVSAINRKRNEGLLSRRAFDNLVAVLYADVGHFTILPLGDETVVESIHRIIRYNLNSADALHLTAARTAKESSRSPENFFFVSSDKRLLTAAKGERMKVLNPEKPDEKSLKRLVR